MVYRHPGQTGDVASSSRSVEAQCTFSTRVSHQVGSSENRDPNEYSWPIIDQSIELCTQ